MLYSCDGNFRSSYGIDTNVPHLAELAKQVQIFTFK